MTISPAEFMSASPKPLNGSSPWASRYAGDIRKIWTEHAARAPRTLQEHLGPSELGSDCDRQVAGKMAGLPSTNHVVDPWPSIVGTACHLYAVDVFAGDNARHGTRWLTESRVTPHPDHPGTADLYDGKELVVGDHKFLGPTSMAKVRAPSGPPRKYVVQLLLYGLGYRRLGFPVRRVALIAYPRTSASLDGLYVWDREYSPADDELISEVFQQTETRQLYAQALHSGQLTLNQIPFNPDSDECYFCPFYRPQAAKDGGLGCPGTAAH